MEPVRQTQRLFRLCLALGSRSISVTVVLAVLMSNALADRIQFSATGSQFDLEARIEALRYAVNWSAALERAGLAKSTEIELRINGKRYRTGYDPARAAGLLRKGDWPSKLRVPLGYDRQFDRLARLVAADLTQIGMRISFQATNGNASQTAPFPFLRNRQGSSRQDAALSLAVQLVRAEPTPQVVGQHIDKARDALNKADITVLEAGTVASKWPVGVIAEQSPPAKEPLAKDRTIRVKTSRGQPAQFVPYVLGQTPEQAKDTLKRNGVTNMWIEVVDRAASTKPPGTIITQVPRPKIQIVKPTPLRVVLSTGPPQPVRTLGDLTGLSVDDAAAVVRDLERDMRVTDSVHHATKAGTVIGQFPEPGTPVTEFKVVRVLQSLGPAPVTPPPETDDRRLPDLRGMPHGDAVDAVRLLDREMRVVQRLHDPAPEGTVVGQDPPPGTPIAKIKLVEVTESRGPEPILPDLVGLTIPEAKDVLGRDAPPLEQAGQRYAKAEAGRIIGQAPRAGTAMSRVGAVEVTLSLGPEPVLPDLTNQPVGAATELLAELDLRHQIDGRDHAEAVPETVIDQQPPAGTPITKVEMVRLRLSLGPEPVLPDLTGLSFAAAGDRLDPLNLILSLGGEDHARLGRGLVLRQQPAAGTPVGGISEVQVWISLGPEPAVPDLTGMSVPDAELRYASLLQAIVVTDTRWSLRTEDMILSQTPLAGTPMPETRTVAVVIAAPPVPPPLLPWLAGGTVALITALSLAVRKWTKAPPEAPTSPSSPLTLRVEPTLDTGRQSVEASPDESPGPAVHVRLVSDPGAQSIKVDDGDAKETSL